jgi:tetratricopeptide (TPR) repeat protein
MIKIPKFLLLTLIGILSGIPWDNAYAVLSRDESLLLFSQANQSFSKANETKNPQEEAVLYENAILDYEKIIEEGGIKNAKLYYNLANAYVLSNNIGKAILNYRRAQLLDSSNPDIYKNLNFARNKRTDNIPVSSQKKILERLFFWHYDFSARTRFIIGGICFAVFCIWLTLKLWIVRWPATKVVCTISALLAVCMISSVTAEYYTAKRNLSGVIIAQSVIARQGDGNNYPQSFNEPLHAGVEFDVLERRSSWLHIQLANGHDAWIPEQSSEFIQF